MVHESQHDTASCWGSKHGLMCNGSCDLACTFNWSVGSGAPHSTTEHHIAQALPCTPLYLPAPSAGPSLCRRSPRDRPRRAGPQRSGGGGASSGFATGQASRWSLYQVLTVERGTDSNTHFCERCALYSPSAQTRHCSRPRPAVHLLMLALDSPLLKADREICKKRAAG